MLVLGCSAMVEPVAEGRPTQTCLEVVIFPQPEPPVSVAVIVTFPLAPLTRVAEPVMLFIDNIEVLLEDHVSPKLPGRF